MIKDDNFYDEAWNPITGSSDGVFPYPYAKGLCRRFSGDTRHNLATEHIRREGNIYVLDKPFPSSVENHFITCPAGTALTVHNYRFNQLSEKFKSGRNIFVCQCGNLFDRALPEKEFWRVIETCHANPQHNYIFLVAPENESLMRHRLETRSELFTENMWFGMVITDTLAVFKTWQKNYKANFFLYYCETAVVNGGVYLNGLDFEISYWKLNVPWLLLLDKPLSINRKRIEDISEQFGIPIYGVADKMPKQLPEAFKHHTVAPGKKKLLLAKCAWCGKECRKKEMYTICSYLHRGDSSKPIGWVCKDDYEAFVKGVFGGN